MRRRRTHRREAFGLVVAAGRRDHAGSERAGELEQGRAETPPVPSVRTTASGWRDGLRKRVCHAVTPRAGEGGGFFPTSGASARGRDPPQVARRPPRASRSPPPPRDDFAGGRRRPADSRVNVRRRRDRLPGTARRRGRRPRLRLATVGKGNRGQCDFRVI